MMAYKGNISPDTLKHPEKYIGDVTKIVYRSMWERNAMMWCDSNPSVVQWSSEELFFPYDHPIKGRRARYFPDLYLKMVDGIERVIEIKPLKEVNKPVEGKRKTKRYINEVATYVVNQEKWKMARYYCNRLNFTFEIWTEETLSSMGILKVNSAEKKVLREAHARTKKPKLKPLARPKRPRPKRKS